MRTYFQRLLLIIPLFVSCDKFLDIDPPKNQLVGESVFEETATIDGAFAHIYAELRESAFTNGGSSGLSCSLGYYADELDHLNQAQQTIHNYYTNSVLPMDYTIDQLWNSSYNLIYDCNSILEGIEASGSLNQKERDRFMGEAFFLRSFLYFHLANLFGDVPFIDSTDYQINSTVSKSSYEYIYEMVIEDVQEAKKLLYESREDLNFFRANYWTASALLARIHLYKGNWESAKKEAVNVINEGPFELEQDLSKVFLKGSKESIWHLDARLPGSNTGEGGTFIATSTPPWNVSLSHNLLESFEEDDQRLEHWVGSISNEEQTWYFPFKYKNYGLTDETMECSILMRFSELYLIVAEASIQMDQISDGLFYLNIIRNRASLPSLSILDKNDILKAISHERRIEFFSEQGHRFFDLKRTSTAHGVLSQIKPFWDETDILLPLPDKELLKNPNLLPQNNGY